MARRDGQVLFAEVKNLSAKTWRSKGTDDVMAQLKRHNRGIESIMLHSDERGPVVGKVLMVAEKGFDEAIDKDGKDTFEAALKQIGWQLVKIPEHNITSVKTFIDSLR